MNGTIIKGGYAPIEAVTNEKIEYDKIKWLVSEESGGREYDFSPKGDSKEIWADGKAVLAVDKNSGYDGTLKLIDIIDSVAKDWYGNVIGQSGRAEYAKAAERPKFAWIQAEERSDGKIKVTIYPYCYVPKRTNRKGKTSEESGFDYEFVDHNIAIRPNPVDGLVFAEKYMNEFTEFESMPEDLKIWIGAEETQQSTTPTTKSKSTTTTS